MRAFAATVIVGLWVLACAPWAAADTPFNLQIVDKETGNAIPGVSIRVRMERSDQTLQTNDNGQIDLSVPDGQLRFLWIRVDYKDYSPVQLSWQNERPPEKYVLKLEKGTSIGGIVRNENGEPVEGATVGLIIQKTSDDPHEQSAIQDAQIITDDEGRWRYDRAPQTPRQVLVRLSHPDYVSDDVFGQSTRNIAVAEYRNHSAVLVLKKGIDLTGTVTDEAGQPISGATVRQGQDRWGTNYPETRTDRAGQFKFTQVRPGEIILTVQAPGHAPDLKRFQATSDPVDFKLTKGLTLKARVVDAKGQPIPGARVVADTWRGARTLDWQRQTDREGRFEWKEAPADVVQFHVLKQGYMTNRNANLKAGDQEQVITLRPPLRIVGEVTDPLGDAIPSFRVIPGNRYPGSNDVHFDYNSGRDFTDGQFDWTMSEPTDGFQVRIEAKGYRPALSRLVTPDEGIDEPVVLSIELEFAQDLKVTLHTPDGKPAVGARAMHAVKNQAISITDGQFANLRESQQASISAAADTGILSVSPPADDSAYIAIVHAEGYATVSFADLKKSADIPFKLTPWTTIEATFRMGSKPFANGPVGVNSTSFEAQQHQYYISFDGSGVTDADGRVTFKHMPAGSGWLSDYRPRPNGQRGGLLRGAYHANPGETVKIQVGGKGRPVIGRLAVPDSFNKSIDFPKTGESHLYNLSANPARDEDRLKFPDNWSIMTLEQRRQWWQGPEVAEFVAKAEDRAKARAASSVPTYYNVVTFHEDGTFRIEDLESGKYEMTFYFREPWSSQNNRQEMLLSGTHSFEIAEIPGGQTDEPQDLGAILLKTPDATGRVNPDQPSPEPGSPGEAYARFQAAQQTGDVETMLAVTDLSHPSAEQYVRIVGDVFAARLKVLATIDEVLGRETGDEFSRLTGIQRPGEGPKYPFLPTWEIQGDHAYPTGRFAGHGLGRMSRVDGQWKFNLGDFFAANAAISEKAIERYAKISRRMETLIEDIRARKYNEAKAIIQAMSQPN